MVARGTFYGVVAVLVAVSLISSLLAVGYYVQYQQQQSTSQRYAAELATAISQYRTLDTSYRTSLSGYNMTISLLSQALGSLNTTTPSYKEGSAALATLWSEYLGLAKAGGHPLSYSVNMLLMFGNGTRRWFNDSAVQPGWNAYLVTLVLTNGNVQATWYPSYGEHFVNGMVGLENDPTSNEGWLLWTWNASSDWQLSNVGPDDIPIYNSSVFAWTYCSYNPVTYAPLCSP